MTKVPAGQDITRPVLILGADGFIGRHLAFAFRAQGRAVIAVARRTGPLARMGFTTLRADLCDPATHDPAFWHPHLGAGDVVNAAGLLTGSPEAFEAVHLKAPGAVYAAMQPQASAVLISAVGVESTTDFARYRRQAEEGAMAAGVTILRPGLVLGDTSYGGSSLLRALAALPWVTPVVGSGAQAFNPVHAADLAGVVAECLTMPPGPGPWDIGGPETLTQADLMALYRGWMGLAPARTLRLGTGVARVMGQAGDALRLGPLSATSVAQLQTGVLADPVPLLDRIVTRPRGVSEFVTARPAGTQDLWQARLYLLKPAIRLVLAAMWLASGLVGLFLPGEQFLPLLARSGLPDAALMAMARAGGVIDLALAAALLRNWRPRATGLVQFAMVAGYTAGLTLLAPAEWMAPLGGLLKNLPVLALIAVHVALAEER